jgi:potassium-transporting ATPase KdpC subunit
MDHSVKAARNGFLLLLTFTLIFGGIYPFVTFVIGKVLFPFQTGGSLLFYPKTQKIIGSKLIGQNFTSPIYFHPRPSLGGYDAAHSQGSKYSVISAELYERMLACAKEYRELNALTDSACVPIDAVTSSSSGLDPHISISNALLQAARVADARGIPKETVDTLIEKFTEHPFFGLIGETRVNVLMLNLGLDHASVEKEE